MVTRKFWIGSAINRRLRPAVLAIFFAHSGLFLNACSPEQAPGVSPGQNAGNRPVSMTSMANGKEALTAPHRAVTSGSHNAKFSGINPEDLLEELSWLMGGTQPQNNPRSGEILELLGRTGYAGMVAITNYLQTSSAWRDGSEAERALRQTLLELLLNSTEPGLEILVLELMHSTTDAMEVALLGEYLESKDMGHYSEAIRAACERALQAAESFAVIPGSLFQLLGETGDSDTLGLLVDMPMHQDAYVSVALSLLPDGSGISVLEQDARLFEKGEYTTHGRLAIELLAQQAYQYPDAFDVLLDLAGKNLIPEDIWPQLVALAAGSQVITLSPPAGSLDAWNTIYRTEGNQSLYLVPGSLPFETPEQINQRLYVLAQLQQLVPQEILRQLTAAQDLLVQLKQDRTAVSAIFSPGASLRDISRMIAGAAG